MHLWTLEPTDTIPETIKAAEHQQHPCDPVHQRKPDSHDFLFEKVDQSCEQDKPGQGTEKDAGNKQQARENPMIAPSTKLMKFMRFDRLT